MKIEKNEPRRFAFYYDKKKTIISYEIWILDGKIMHREDGPAFVQYYQNGSIKFQRYYLNDCKYSREEYIKSISQRNKVRMLLNE